MTALYKIAFYQNRRDEAANRELARELAGTKNREGIREIAENLWHKNANVQSDCVKVLYEVGYLDPELIAEYMPDFLKLLKSKNNRMVWGSMIALATIADIKAEEIYPQHEMIEKTMDNGSVITVDNGVKMLAIVAGKCREQNNGIFSYLLGHLETCRPRDVPRLAEKTLPAVNRVNKDDFIQVLKKRMTDISSSQVARLKDVIEEAASRGELAAPVPDSQ